jgi:hypothetical protein
MIKIKNQNESKSGGSHRAREIVRWTPQRLTMKHKLNCIYAFNVRLVSRQHILSSTEKCITVTVTVTINIKN